MKNLLTILLILISFYVKGSNYYFSLVAGNDSRSESQAQNEATPWKTIAKLNSIFPSLLPGDSILFKAGETWTGTGIAISKSGTNNNPIVIGTYGAGAAPIITGLIPLTWINIGANKWESNETLSPSALNIVTVNGIPQRMGRYPNYDAGNGGYLNISTVAKAGSTVTLSSYQSYPLSASPDFDGAELVVRSERWILDRHKNINHSVKTVSFVNNVSNYDGIPGFGFILHNHESTLDQQNEWFYTSGKKVRMYSVGEPVNVKATNINNLVHDGNIGKNNITITGITFDGANLEAIDFGTKSASTSHHIIIKNCTVKNSGTIGIFSQARYSTFENNTVDWSLDNGIEIGGGGLPTNGGGDYDTVRYNTVTNTHMIAGAGLSSNGHGAGINIKGNFCTVEWNQIINSGYIGVKLSAIDAPKVNYNYIANIGTNKSDGAGIYTEQGSGDDNITTQMAEYIGNVIINLPGAPYGTPDAKILPMFTAGIYIDQGGDHVKIKDNTIVNSERGIWINPSASYIEVTGNTSYNNRIAQLSVYTRPSPRNVFNNVFSGNIWIARGSQYTALFRADAGASASSINNIGTFSNNFYVRPTLAGSIISDAGTGRTLASWKAQHPGFDVGSSGSPYSYSQIQMDTSFRFEVNTTFLPKTVSLPANYIDVHGTDYLGTITLAPLTAAALFKTSELTTPIIVISDVIGIKSWKIFKLIE